MKKNIILNDVEEIYNSSVEWEELKDTTILITGAYGMLASYMVFMFIYLNEEKNMNIKIIAQIRSKEKLEKRFGKYAHKPYFKVYNQSINEKIELGEKIDYIIHAASFASPNYYGVCPVDVITPNVLGTYNLLELARQKEVKGFLLFSTGDIYGVCEGTEYIVENSQGRMDTLDIHNCYSESKRLAETMCKSFYVQYGVPVKIARIWHTYAPTMDIESDPRVFSSFMKDLVYKRDIVMKSEGQAKRSFCYVTDAISGYFKILIKGKNGEAYNVCNTLEWYSIVELAELMTQVDPELKLRVIKVKREATDRYIENSVANYIPPSNEKIKVELNWEPKVGCLEGFKRVYSYLSGNIH